MPIARRQGFTLLELLVVMLLLGLTMGLVAPQAGRWLSSAQQRGWRADLKAKIAGLPVVAFQSGADLSVSTEQLIQGIPGSPTKLRLPAPLRYSAIGMAYGGTVELVQGTSLEVWTVAPVTGEVTESPLASVAP